MNPNVIFCSSDEDVLLWRSAIDRRDAEVVNEWRRFAEQVYPLRVRTVDGQPIAVVHERSGRRMRGWDAAIAALPRLTTPQESASVGVPAFALTERGLEFPHIHVDRVDGQPSRVYQLWEAVEAAAEVAALDHRHRWRRISRTQWLETVRMRHLVSRLPRSRA